LETDIQRQTFSPFSTKLSTTGSKARSCSCTTRCITLQHVATRCNTLQHAATRCNTLQHAATRCNTLQRTATYCNTLQHTATYCNTLQHTATHCNTLRRNAATHCDSMQQSDVVIHSHSGIQERHHGREDAGGAQGSQVNNATRCTILQHTAIHCNTLQHTAT